MGIPSYFKYIITNYNSIFKKNKHIKIIHNLFIDSNSIVYDSIRELDITKYKIDEIERYEADLIRKVFEKMKFYIDVINPKKMVYIAFDGVVPYAKMEQQRQRRYKSWVLKNKENELERMFINNDDSDRNIKDVFSWDQTAITPGTEFMRKLNSYISNKIAEIENSLGEIRPPHGHFRGQLRRKSYPQAVIFYVRVGNDHQAIFWGSGFW